MVARNRTRSVNVATGPATWEGTGLAPVGQNYLMQEYCDDVVGNRRGENPFYHYRFSGVNWINRGKTGSTPGFRWNYNGLVNSGNPGFLGNLTTPPSDYVALEMARARTNPNNPDVDIPVLVFEMKDIPRLIKQAGDLILYGRGLLNNGYAALNRMPYRAADAYLGYEFGLSPLVRDLQKTVGVAGLIAKRLKTLDQLYHGGGSTYSKSATVWSEHVYGPPSSYYLSSLYAESNVFSFKEHTEYKKWVSFKWKPTSPPPLTPQDKLALARRLVFGLDLSFATIWEAMPWSWLIDWFTIGGDIVRSTRNTVPVTASGSCVMTQRRALWQIGNRVAGSGGFPDPAGSGAISQLRVPGALISGSSLLKADFPILDGKQLSILSALAVTYLGR
jgi:hypothetical protein